MKIITFDCETRGLFGEIFAFGYYDGNNFHKCEPVDFIKILTEISKDEEVFAFAHNLDFDFAKLWKAYEKTPLEVNWDDSLIIHNNLVRVKIKGGNFTLCDSFHILPYSLENISQTFELSVKKLDMEEEFTKYGNKNEYFKNVSKDDPKMLEYLENDCISLYEALHLILKLSELGIEEFIKCPTTASLSMEIYRKICPEEYKMITDVPYSPILENFGREAYKGARVEVVKAEMGKGYHYDINSLYPFVMRDFEFPVGRFWWWRDRLAMQAYKTYKGKPALYRANVTVPENIYIPILPHRTDKLYFPVGEFSDVWTGEELREAEKQGAKIHITEAIVWNNTFPIFKRFVQKMEFEKNNSKGARRSFFKLIQNSLYGKFGMKRERQTYINDTEENRAKLIQKGKKFLTIVLSCKKTMLLIISHSYAKYIQPHISAYITSLARLELFKAIDKYKDYVCYYDTDSIVLTKKLSKNMVDDIEYGKWKLEAEIEKAVFIQPKLYAELLKNGSEVLKSKGLIKEERKKLNFGSYIEIMGKVKKGVDRIEIYRDIPSRQKFMTSLKNKEDTEKIVYLKKSLNLLSSQKRTMDYINNTSKPLIFIKNILEK